MYCMGRDGRMSRDEYKQLLDELYVVRNKLHTIPYQYNITEHIIKVAIDELDKEIRQTVLFMV